MFQATEVMGICWGSKRKLIQHLRSISNVPLVSVNRVQLHINLYFIHYFSFIFGHRVHRIHVGSYLPDQGLNPCPLHWKYGVLTTGPPGKSQARPCGGISDSSLPLTPRIPAISKSSPLSPSPPAACPRHRHLSPG